MNAHRRDDSETSKDTQDAVQGLVRATTEAMQAFWTTDWAASGDKPGLANPMMATPANLMAAATAYGIKMSGQWAGLFLKAMEETAPAAEENKPVSEPVQQPELKDEALKGAAVKDESSVDVVSADDLKRIPGIGPKLEKVLAARGVTRFAQLADMDETALLALDSELGLDGRVLKDDWAGQAKALMAGNI